MSHHRRPNTRALAALYISAVTRTDHSCEYGHRGCGRWEGGPCSDELAHEFELVDIDGNDIPGARASRSPASVEDRLNTRMRKLSSTLTAKQRSPEGKCPNCVALEHTVRRLYSALREYTDGTESPKQAEILNEAEKLVKEVAL